LALFKKEGQREPPCKRVAPIALENGYFCKKLAPLWHFLKISRAQRQESNTDQI
jgi:hypothetical protein